MNLSDLLSVVTSYGGNIISITSDITLSENGTGVAVLQPNADGWIATLPGSSSGTVLTLGNDSDYDMQVSLDGTNKVNLLAGNVITCFKGPNSWYVIDEDSADKVPWCNPSSNENVFNSGPTYNISAARLTDTKFVVAYRGNGNYGTAIIGDVSGTTITFGSAYVFNSAYTNEISVARLTDTKFVVAYQDNGNNNYGTAIIGNVSGTTITFGSEYVFNSGTTYYPSVAVLTDTKFVVAYEDNGNNNYGTAIIGDVSGTTITFGSEYVFNSGTTNYISVARLTDTKFVVAYLNGGILGTAIIGDVSGTTITFGSAYVFNPSDGTTYTSVARLTDTKFVVAYRHGGSNNYGKAIIGDVSGTTITFGSEYVFNSGASYNSVARLTDTKFVVAYMYEGNHNYGAAIIGDVSGTTITFGSAYVFNYNTTFYNSVAVLTDTKFVVAYQDNGNNYYGTAALVWDN